MNNFLDDDIEIFTGNSQPNGIEYLKKSDITLPLRIKNKIKEKSFTSELEFYQYVQELINKNTSYYLFPNDICFFYPKIVESKSTKNNICHLSGAPINIGESYYTFRPILENLTINKVFTIKKSIIASIGYIDYFPTTLLEFEEWCRILEEANYHNDGSVDFYNLSTIAGDTCLCLREFKNNSKKGPVKKLESTNIESKRKNYNSIYL